MSSGARARWGAAGAALLALLIAPAPLLPPHRLAEVVQSTLGIGWKAAYLVAALGLQAAFHGSVGVLAGLAVDRALAPRARVLQAVAVPFVVVGTTLLIRSIKLGHVPIWINAVVPIGACVCGVGLGLGMLRRGWKGTLVVAAVVGTAYWGMRASISAGLGRDTEAHLRRLAARAPGVPAGEAQFGSLLQSAFAPLPGDAAQGAVVRHNRAAILALGIAIGDERLARYAGLDPKDEGVRGAVSVGQGTTLRGRSDWSRHYALSAALAVLEHPLVSDAGGLLKEQLDALTRGSGFSFGDLAADRAGVRFAVAATRSEAHADAMRTRLRAGFQVDEFFPPAADLPKDLSPERFRALYGGVGSARYRRQVETIESRLDHCAGLSVEPRD